MRALAAALACLAAPALACAPDTPPPGSQIARVSAGDIRTAAYDDATGRYAHGVLGDATEAGRLVVSLADGTCLRAALPETAVFEDISPRIADLDGDGRNEVIVVESTRDAGGSLSVYGVRDGALREIAASPHIGRPNRWLAPVGIADVDGDGRIEIPVVDRPHLARVLQIWEWRDGGLHLEAQMEGVTNHRIGDDWISGGIRDCGQGPQMVVLSPDWREVRAVSWDGATFRMGRIGPNTGRASVEAAVACN